MANYNEKLNILFDKWEAESIENGLTGFCRDGLMYKYGDKKNDVDELWDKSKNRILFLLKDPKEYSGDSREWLQIEENQQLRSQFLKKLAYVLYGLSNVKDGKTADFWDITHEQLVTCFNEIPFAFVESKKEAGKNEISGKELDKYINDYGDFLSDEINILKPNIVICFGGSQHHFALTKLFNDVETIDKNIHIDNETKTLIIYSYHPSARTSYESFYDEIMRQYGKFLAQESKFK